MLRTAVNEISKDVVRLDSGQGAHIRPVCRSSSDKHIPIVIYRRAEPAHPLCEGGGLQPSPAPPSPVATHGTGFRARATGIPALSRCVVPLAAAARLTLAVGGAPQPLQLLNCEAGPEGYAMMPPVTTLTFFKGDPAAAYQHLQERVRVRF